MSLQDKLNSHRKKLNAAEDGAKLLEAVNRSVAELIADGAPGRALIAGDRAPEFSLLTSERKTFSLSKALSSGPLVLAFSRGVWCEFCNLELIALEEARPEIERRGASIVAVSPQTAANGRKSQRINGLGFPQLFDKGGEVSSAYGVKWQLPVYLRQIYERAGIDLLKMNGDDSWTLPMLGRYVIDRRGMIVYAEVNADHTMRPDPAELMPTLDRLAREFPE